MAKISNELTKIMMEEYGIIGFRFDPSENEWYLIRKWKKNGKGLPKIYEIKNSIVKCKHKYGIDREYKKWTFSFNKKTINLTVGRALLAWKWGIVEEGYDCSHIDDDPFNNYIELDNYSAENDNIIIESHEENMKRRFEKELLTGKYIHNQYNFDK